MADPPHLILSSMKRNQTNQLIHDEKEFTLSILPANVDPFVVANFGFQSGRDVEKWPNVEYEMKDGLPVLASAVSCVRCRVIDLKELETHTMFITEVVDGWMGKSEASPLIYGDFLRDMKDDALAAFKKFKEGQ
jgi:flavin reductase (DIM6/NTAB) family NADH-FMN oxidoreductase RutF